MTSVQDGASSLPSPPGPIGLIAGGGRLPALVAEGMRAAGYSIVCAGLSGLCSPELRSLSTRFQEVGVLRPGSWGRYLRRNGAHYAVMIGRIDKAAFLHDWTAIIRNIPDLTAVRIYRRLRRDKRSHLILAAVADELALAGVRLIDSTTYIAEHMASAGVMTQRGPTAGQQADIEFGWPLLRDLLKLDIGQSIAVRDRDVVAVEAVEGTDRMIERAGMLCAHSGWTVLKGARAGHDRRSDVPTVGPETIRNLHRAGGRCLAVAAEEVIIVDKPATIRLADEIGVCIVGVEEGGRIPR